MYIQACKRLTIQTPYNILRYLDAPAELTMNKNSISEGLATLEARKKTLKKLLMWPDSIYSSRAILYLTLRTWF